jgi:DNA-binding transcriptional MerR regulator
MSNAEESYSLKELCREANVTERTVRYYIQEGLLPPPKGVGVFARYDRNHLLRLKLIRRLKEEYLPLAEIRKRLADLSQTELEELAQQVELSVQYDEEEADAKSYLDTVLNKRGTNLQSQILREQTQTRARNMPPPPAAKPVPAPSTPDKLAIQKEKPVYHQPVSDNKAEEWKRVKVADGLEINYQANTPEKQKLIAQLLEFAQRLFN